MQTGLYPNYLSMPQTAQPPRARKAFDWGFPELFILGQTILPGLLYLPGTQVLRVPIRISAYAIGLIALWYFLTHRKDRSPLHPSVPWLIAAAIYVTTQIFHPSTNTLLAGAGEAVMYLAVFSPVIWAPSLIKSRDQVWRVLIILLVCNGISALVGVLQVYDQRWLPAEFSKVAVKDEAPLAFYGPHNELIIRPCGLTDAPGGVCAPASVAALLGLVLATLPETNLILRVFYFGFAFLGFAAIYLSHVRTSLLTTVGSLLVFSILLYYHGKRLRSFTLTVFLFILFFGGLFYAARLGGSSVVNRFSSLMDEDPVSMYYKSRGNQVDSALQNFVVQYPLGAGLGRCGMMRTYFGDETNRDSPLIWAEIQIPLWLLDGGVLLVCLYSVGVYINFRNEARAALSKSGDWATTELACVIVIANLNVVSHCLSTCPFIAESGVQYWFLAGVLHGLVRLNQTAQPARTELNGSLGGVHYGSLSAG